jgi:uncharacterized protein (TIGR03435 family)
VGPFVRRFAGSLILLLVCCAGIVRSQTGSLPAFDSASVKPSPDDAGPSHIVFPPGGRVDIGNMTLREMLAGAYDVQPFQVTGGPDWLDAIHYNVLAKGAEGAKRAEVLVMLQSLLTERFHMTIRRETRQLPTYALVMARKDRKPGPALVEAKAGSCQQADPTDPLAVDPDRLCGNWELGPEGLGLVSGHIGSLTGPLTRLLGRKVVDKTGLTRNYDVHLEWSPDDFLAMRAPAGAPLPPGDGSGPSVFAVFRDQLGIAFQAEKGPVEILVIQRAEKPAAN